MTPLHGLFQRRIAGDDALLELARLRFEQAGLAAEVYAASAAELEGLLRVAPGARAPMVHLPRDVDLLGPGTHERVASLAEGFGSRVGGFVVHDRAAMAERLPELTDAACALSRILGRTGDARLFIEYAAGLEPDRFVALASSLVEAPRVGVCIDTGHVGIRAARAELARRHTYDATDLASLRPTEPHLAELVDDVQAAVGHALPTLLTLIEQVAALGTFVHFHLHDGHPLQEGLSDHFGFLHRLPIPFAHDGIASLDPLFGVEGLRRIVQTMELLLDPDRRSATLEIHEHRGRLPVEPDVAARLFGHWRDLGNAERMNFWLRELAENASLVRAFEDPVR